MEAILAPVGGALAPAAATDDQIIAMWLYGRSAHTLRAYAGDVARFRAFVGKPLAAVTLPDLQAFADALRPLAPSSQGCTLAAIKSLLRYAHGLGYLLFDVGKPLRRAAVRAGIDLAVTPHWLRHSHASHALEHRRRFI